MIPGTIGIHIPQSEHRRRLGDGESSRAGSPHGEAGSPRADAGSPRADTAKPDTAKPDTAKPDTQEPPPDDSVDDGGAPASSAENGAWKEQKNAENKNIKKAAKAEKAAKKQEEKDIERADKKSKKDRKSVAKKMHAERYIVSGGREKGLREFFIINNDEKMAYLLAFGNEGKRLGDFSVRQDFFAYSPDILNSEQKIEYCSEGSGFTFIEEEKCDKHMGEFKGDMRLIAEELANKDHMVAGTADKEPCNVVVLCPLAGFHLKLKVLCLLSL